GTGRDADHEIVRLLDVQNALIDHRVPLRILRGFLGSDPLADPDEPRRKDAHRDDAAEQPELAGLARAARNGEVPKQAAHELEAAEKERSPCDQVRAL